MRLTEKRGACACFPVLHAEGVKPDEKPPPAQQVLNAGDVLVLTVLVGPNNVIHRVGTESESSHQKHFLTKRVPPLWETPIWGFMWTRRVCSNTASEGLKRFPSHSQCRASSTGGPPVHGKKSSKPRTSLWTAPLARIENCFVSSRR